MKKTFFILGAADPEMNHIEEVLQAEGHPYVYAAHDGNRVTTRNAYQADSFVSAKGVEFPANINDYEVATLECGYEIGRWSKPDHLLDHHQEGDPGFDKPPSEYWEGSCVGQLYNLLDLEPTAEARLVAAADHCLGAAYRGDCPDITPTDIFNYRIKTRSTFLSVSKEELMNKIKVAQKKMDSAPQLDFAGTPVYDMRASFVPELPEAALAKGAAYVATLNAPSTGNKTVIGGNTSPDSVEYFIETWAPQHKLKDIYGSPQRGYAGGKNP